jgi:hypothetical protein
MRKLVVPILCVLFALALGGVAMASPGNAANQTVSFQVSAICEFAVSGNPGPLHVTAAVAGQNPTPATDATTTYALTANESAQRITGKLDSDMPAGLVLKAALQAPTGGTSTGATALSSVDADLVTGISRVAETAKGITYWLYALPGAGVVGLTSRTVTLTLTDAS